jgi:signal transduction histidine kinase
MPDTPQLARQWQHGAARVVGVLASITGVVVLVGWHRHWPGVHAINPAFGSMSPRAALCFVPTGAALALLSRYRPRTWSRRIGLVSAGIGALVAALTLSAAWMGWPGTGGLRDPFLAIAAGQMPPASAIAFVALNAALLVIDVGPRRIRPSELLVAVSAGVALLALIAYTYTLVAQFGVESPRPLAFQTVLLIAALGVGVLFARPEAGLMQLATSRGVTGVMLRRLMPAAIGIPVVAGALAIVAERAGWYPRGLTLAYYTVAIIVIFGVLIAETALELFQTDLRRHRAEERLRLLNRDLEERVASRTAQLEAANRELEAFSYSVSHDLRAPLRTISGFTEILVEELDDRLDAESRSHLSRVRNASQSMGALIDGLLALSRITRNELRMQPIDLTSLAGEIVAGLRERATDGDRAVTIAPGLGAAGHPTLIRSVLENLLSNAWKFTRGRAGAAIEVGSTPVPDGTAFFVRDNGAGFDMAYAGKLFGVFQRLHGRDEFEGTGIGLATVQRIIARHGGRVWAEGAVEQGATFFFTLPLGAEPPTAL